VFGFEGAGGAPQINEQTLGQHDQPLAVGKDDLVDLRLDLSQRQSRNASIWISLSKWPILQTKRGYWTQGLWTTYGPELRALIDSLHWAGTETSPDWNGKWRERCNLA
jgi:hypothetical protein